MRLFRRHKSVTYIGIAFIALALCVVLLVLAWRAWWPRHVLGQRVDSTAQVHITYSRTEVGWDSVHPTLIMGRFDCSHETCKDTPRLQCSEFAKCETSTDVRLKGSALYIGGWGVPFELESAQQEHVRKLSHDRNVECATAAHPELTKQDVAVFCISRLTGSFIFFATR